MFWAGMGQQDCDISDEMNIKYRSHSLPSEILWSKQIKCNFRQINLKTQLPYN